MDQTKTTLLIAMSSFSLLFADELGVEKKSPIKGQFTYISAGVGTFLNDEYLPWGALAVGHRSQWECH